MRGRLTSLQQMGIVVGILVAFLVDYWITLAAGGVSEPFWFGLEAWRCMFLTEALPALALVGASLVIPESPRFLVGQGREDEALVVLQRIDASQGPATVAAIRGTVATAHKPSLRDLRGPAGARPAHRVDRHRARGAAAAGRHQRHLLLRRRRCGRPWASRPTDSLQINVISGVINILAHPPGHRLVDRVGRRPLLLIGSAGMTVTLGDAGRWRSPPARRDAQGQRGPRPRPPAWSPWWRRTSTSSSSAFTWGPVVWVLLGEMFGNTIRGAALAVAVTAQWLANWLVTVTFPPMLNELGPAVAYAVYALFAAISLFFVSRYIKETKGRELEQM